MRVNAAKVRKASPRASKQCALHRSKPHKPRRGLGVANARLGRVEHRAARPRRRLQSGRRAPRSTAPASLAARAQHSLRGGHLDGVAQRGARAVQLDALHVTGARARGRKRAAQHTLLRRPVGRRQRACAAVLVHAARQHRRVRLRGRPATQRRAGWMRASRALFAPADRPRRTRTALLTRHKAFPARWRLLRSPPRRFSCSSGDRQMRERLPA